MAEISEFYATAVGAVGDAPTTAAGYSESRLLDVYRSMTTIDPTLQCICAGRGAEFLATGSATPVVVQSGEAWVDGRHYLSDASINVAISTPASTRIDRIVLRRDATAKTVRVVALTGTAGGAMASLTQNSTTWEVDLWWATITSGGVITLTDKRVFAASPLVRGAIDGSTITYNTSSKKIQVASVTGAMLSALTITSQITSTVNAQGSASGYLGSAASPSIGLSATGAASDTKTWGLYVGASGGLALATYTDANVFGTNALVFTRSGTTVTGVSLAAALTVAGAITATSAAIVAGTSVTAGTTLAVGTNATIGGTLGVTGATTLTSTLSAAAGTLVANSGAVTVNGTLAVTGASTLASASVTANASVGGTLAVTGATTLSSTLAVTSNATVGGTLAVTGLVTLTAGITGGVTIAGTTSLAALTTSGNASLTAGTLAVTGGAVTVNGTLAVSSTLAVTGATTLTGGVTGGLAVTGNLSATGTGTITGALTATSGTLAVTGGLVTVNGSAAISTNLTVSGTITGALAAGSVDNSELANMSAATIKGQIVGGSGAPVDMTPAQALAVVGSAVGGMILIGRQGGSATDWSSSGSTNRTVVPAYVQVGTTDTGGGATATVTFPTAFSNPPVVAYGYAGPATRVKITAISATQVSFQSDSVSTVIYWNATGPV